MSNITGAFNNISHPWLIHNLRKRRLNPRMVTWIASFIKDCSTIIKTNKCSTDIINISIGISQSLPILPILYLFYNADLLEIYLSLSLQVTTGDFIDNTVLLATGFNIAENCEKLKKMHWLCIDWAIKHISKFDPSNYQFVHLSRKRNANINRKLILDGDYKIKAQKSGILLGVEIDNQLRWRNHLNRIKIWTSKSITA